MCVCDVTKWKKQPPVVKLKVFGFVVFKLIVTRSIVYRPWVDGFIVVVVIISDDRSLSSRDDGSRGISHNKICDESVTGHASMPPD